MEGMRVKIKKSDAIGKKIDKNINQQVSRLKDQINYSECKSKKINLNQYLN